MNLFKALFKKTWILCSGLVVVIAVRMGLTTLGDPLGAGFDFALWGVASVLKILVWFSLLQTLPILYRRCNQSPYRAVIFSTTFALLLILIILFLAHQRALVSSIFSNSAIKYYPPTADGINPRAYTGFSKWLSQWQAGQVLMAEILFALSLSLLHGVIGFQLGRKPKVALVVGLLGTFALAVLQWATFGLVVLDYDVFHGDIISGGFLFDLALPTVTDPYAAIGSIVYLMFSLAVLPALRNQEFD